MNIALTCSLGIFIENSLQLSSAPVKLQKRSQRGDFTAQLAVSCSSPGVFVNTAAPYNWHNCQVSATNKLGVLLASAGHVIKGTCFWRRSRGHVTRNHVGATVRLIKWLPLISSVHMKGLCRLDDRFYAASPRDLPRYTKPAAITYRAAMYDMCAFECICVQVWAHLRKIQSEQRQSHFRRWQRACSSVPSTAIPSILAAYWTVAYATIISIICTLYLI